MTIPDATKPDEEIVEYDGFKVQYKDASHRKARPDRKSDVEYVVEERGYGSPCWVWQLAIGRRGYGNLWREGTTKNAHRWFYEQTNGAIPEGMQLDHLCRVRACVNPDHLEPVTARENSHRGDKTRLEAWEIQATRGTPQFWGANKWLAELYGVFPTYVGQIRLGRRRAEG